MAFNMTEIGNASYYLDCISWQFFLTWVKKRTFKLTSNECTIWQYQKLILPSSTVAYWTRIKQLAFICFSPLSATLLADSFPQELSSCCPLLDPLEPNPILELQERQSFSLFPKIPIRVTAGSFCPSEGLTLNPSMLQFLWSDESAKRDFQLPLPTFVA